MKSEITRDVISDLWPLYKAGEASAETKRIVDAFLAEDPAFRTLLEESETIRRGMPDVALSSDAELRLIAVARERLRTNAWLVGAAIGAFVFVSMAFLFGALFFALSRS
jgi:anti-sigma factor RsiW